MKFFETFPVLKSPQFWGVVATAFFQLALTKGWFDETLAEFFRNILAAATTIGTVNKVATKIAAPPKE